MQKLETTENDNGVVALNHVHSIAKRLWSEKVPSNYSQQNQRGKSRGGRQANQRRITPVQVSGGGNWNTENNTPPAPLFEQRPPRQHNFNPPPPPYRNYNYNDGANFDKRRAQIKTLPRKPPDVENFELFPPIGYKPQLQHHQQQAKVVVSPTSSVQTQHQRSTKSESPNPFAATSEESFDPKFERNKICKGVQKVQTEIVSSPSNLKISPGNQILKILKRAEINSSESPKDVATVLFQDDKDLSTDLFTQLTPEQIQELTKLSSDFSESLDSNLCRSLLGEFTFLCQLLVANNDKAVTSVSSGQAEVLATLAPRVWFVTRVFELQLPLISSISPDIIQILNDFYSHRIPESLRKIFESIIMKRTEKDQKRNFGLKNNNFASSVIFQCERDGRNNFPNQQDCQDFGKQRDMFYSIREIWTNHQKVIQNQPQLQQGFDPTYGKVKQIFALNSSPTNLSRLASLFISQCLLDAAAISNNNDYDPRTIENVQRILTSNPSKYEKLRQRMFATDGFIDSRNVPIPDPISFLKYFISISTSPEFNQHLIDHAIHQIKDLESDHNDFEPILNIQKIHLLAQILGFLYYLPYRDECKKPIGPINVEIYINSQIAFRTHQSFPLDLTSILISSIAQRRLVFTLPWIIELLSKADQVAFRLPAYKPVLRLISTIYREILSVKIENTPFEFSDENKTLLRFICGKLFGNPQFPDHYLFGDELKSLDFFLPIKPKKLGGMENEEDDCMPLDLNPEIGLTFLPIWFRQEMKQIMTILSTNATVRGSIPNNTPGIVRHIRQIPAKIPIKTEEIQTTGNLQIDLEVQFFQIHPHFVKKTVDFISERVSSNFIKNLRSTILGEIKTELIQSKCFEYEATVRCKEDIRLKFEEFSLKRCPDAVNSLLGDVVSEPVREISEKISLRFAREKVEAWANQHITRELFPEVSTQPPKSSVVPPTTTSTSSSSNLEEKEKVKKSPPQPVSTNENPGTLFQVFHALHNTIKRLHNSLPIDGALIERILNDSRLIGEKPWVSHHTIDLALAMITFSPKEFTEERQKKFILFWKNFWSEESNTLLRPGNLMLYSKSSDVKITFEKLGNLLRSLLKEKLVSVAEIQESCMFLLRQDWPVEVRLQISEFLKNVLPEMESTKEKEVIDWIAWYCSGRSDDDNEWN